MLRRSILGPLLGLVLAGAGLTPPARAETEADLALVLAVDVSFSMDPDEQKLQRDGFSDAFRSPIVQDAIAHGLNGRIAVIYMEWAGAADQKVVVPWTLIDTPASANAFAALLDQQPTRRAARTSISGAVDFAVKLLADKPVVTNRQVIDVSGDGPNNQGRPIQAARAEALAKAITINGLPIMLKAGGYFDIPDLDLYYRDCVIGGPGAFMVPAHDRDQFRDAIKTKIIMEVAGRSEPAIRFGALPTDAASLIHRVQAEEQHANCLAGEMQWRDRMGN